MSVKINSTKNEEMLGLVEMEHWNPNDVMIRMPEETADDDDEDKELEDGYQHPLLNELVLERVFFYLTSVATEKSKVDHALLTSQRQVCRLWNKELIRSLCTKYTCTSPRDIQNLCNLATDPSSPSQFITSLALKYSQIWTMPDTFHLLWALRNGLGFLEIQAYTLQYSDLMQLPIFCPVLHTLKLSHMNDFPVVNWARLGPFAENWIRPFPALKELQLHHRLYPRTASELIISLLERIQGLNEIEIVADSDYWPSEGLEFLGQELISRPNILQKLKRFNLQSYNCDGFLTGIIPASVPKYLKTPMQYYMNLRSLTIVQKMCATYIPISTTLLEKALSLLLQSSAHSLKDIVIVNTTDALHFEKISIGYVILSEPLPNLQFLCLGNIGVTVETKRIGRGRGGRTNRIEESGILQFFPKIVHLQFWITMFKDLKDQDKGILFEALFPEEERIQCQNQIKFEQIKIHSNLRNLHLRTKIEECHEKLLEKISIKFPYIQSLLLELDAKLLSKVVDLFKNFNIIEFTLVYYEKGYTGMSDFEAAVGGLAFHEDALDIDVSNRLKTRPSLADWKSLTRLNITYFPRNVFKQVFIDHCLFLMPKLLHLELRHFYLHENSLVRLIKKTNLETLVLGNCTILHHDNNFPLIDQNSNFENFVKKYKKNVKVNMRKEDNCKKKPRMADLLHHFEYDNFMSDD